MPGLPVEAHHDDYPEGFSLVVGGPFHALLQRFGLVDSDHLPSLRAALGLALAAWAVPVVIALLQALLDPAYAGGWRVLTDPTVWSRYLVGIAVMIATERFADGRIRLLARQFDRARLLTPNARPVFTAALRLADRRSASAVAESIIGILALAWSIQVTRLTSSLAQESWEGMLVNGEIELSWAGTAASLFSTPLFLFLMFRWIWRFGVWAALLARIARLDLQLMPLHPDRAAGLGFLSLFPGIFSGLIFAVSCVVAASMYKAAQVVAHTQQTLWIGIASWLALMLVLFVGPLGLFVRPLYKAREEAILAYGRLAQLHHLAFHAKWIAAARSGEEMIGSTDPSSVSDLNAAVQATLAMRALPIDRAALVQLLAAAGLPFLAFLASQMPLSQLFALFAGTVL